MCQQSSGMDFDILILVEAGLIALFNLFMYCYFGRVATESFENMADTLYESKWRELPNGLQKFFILMIACMQQPLYYHGFNVAYLNLQTFCKVKSHWRIYLKRKFIEIYVLSYFEQFTHII